MKSLRLNNSGQGILAAASMLASIAIMVGILGQVASKSAQLQQSMDTNHEMNETISEIYSKSSYTKGCPISGAVVTSALQPVPTKMQALVAQTSSTLHLEGIKFLTDVNPATATQAQDLKVATVFKDSYGQNHEWVQTFGAFVKETAVDSVTGLREYTVIDGACRPAGSIADLAQRTYTADTFEIINSDQATAGAGIDATTNEFSVQLAAEYCVSARGLTSTQEQETLCGRRALLANQTEESQ